MVDRAERESHREHKERDIEQIVRYLTSTFDKAKATIGKAGRSKETGPNRAYVLETEFAYLLNEVMVGPPCLLQKNIAECNEFIDQVIMEAQRPATEDAAA